MAGSGVRRRGEEAGADAGLAGFLNDFADRSGAGLLLRLRPGLAAPRGAAPPLLPAAARPPRGPPPPPELCARQLASEKTPRHTAIPPQPRVSRRPGLSRAGGRYSATR